MGSRYHRPSTEARKSAASHRPAEDLGRGGDDSEEDGVDESATADGDMAQDTHRIND